MEICEKENNTHDNKRVYFETLLSDFVSFLIQENTFSYNNIIEQLKDNDSKIIKIFLDSRKENKHYNAIDNLFNCEDLNKQSDVIEGIRKINKILFKLEPQNIKRFYKIIKISSTFCGANKQTKSKSKLKPIESKIINNIPIIKDLPVKPVYSPLYSGKIIF